MGEIPHEEGRLMGEFKWSSLENRIHWQVIISEKESEARRKRSHFEGAGKRTPSLLNLAPTYLHCQIVLNIGDYGEKSSHGEVEPSLDLYFFCQGAGVVSGQPFSIGSFSSIDQAIQDPS